MSVSASFGWVATFGASAARGTIAPARANTGIRSGVAVTGMFAGPA